MAKFISKHFQSPLQPTLAEIDDCIRAGTDAIFIRDDDKFTIEASAKQADRIKSFLLSFKAELEKLGISIVNQNGKIYLSKYTYKYTVRIRERKREIRTLLKKKKHWQNDYEITLVWSGVIAVSFNNYSYGEWYEKKRSPIETSAGAIAIRVNNDFERAEGYRLEEIRAEIAREQRRKEREAHEERMRLERRRHSFLENYFTRIQEIEKLQAMRERLHLMFADTNDVHLRKIDKWLQNEARRIGSQISHKAIKEQLDSSGLFDGVML